MELHGDRQQRRLALSRISDGYKQAVALNTAQHLDIFTQLASGAMSADDLARAISCDPRGTRLLLNALAGMDLLTIDGEDRFALQGSAEEFLAPGAEFYMGDIIEHAYSLMKRWVHLDEILLGESAPPPRSGGRSPRELSAFILGMQNISKQSAEEVADALDLRGVKRILDVGGGPGTYLYAFLKRLPEASGAVLDRPPVVEIAQDQAKQEGVEQRVELIPGDMFATHFGSGWDLVFLGNIIHSFSDERNLELMKRCSAALEPGGRLAIKDFFLDASGTTPVDGALFSLNMLSAGNDGRAYKRTEVEGWLREAGLTPVSLHRVGTHSGVLVAVKE